MGPRSHRALTFGARGARSCLCAAALLMTTTACDTTSGQARRPGGRSTGPSVPIETTTVSRVSVQRLVDFSGTLLSPDQAKVSSEVAGMVRDVPVQLGTGVRAGDVLVRLEPRELALAQERAESALRQVEAQLGIDRAQDRQPPPDEAIASVKQAAANRDDARAAYARAEQLRGRGLMSQMDHDTADTRLKVMEANYQAAIDTIRSLKASLQDRRAAFDLAQKKLADAVIRAPVAGSVSERLVQPGEFIRENTPVVTIVQMNPLKLRSAMQEKYAGGIMPGQQVDFQVEAFGKQPFTGKIAYVSPAVDQTTRTFVVEAIVENPERRLKPGFFAKGTVQTRVDENVMAVPEDAISNLAGVTTVYVVENGKVRQQQITTGERVGRMFEVASGLTGDETLAATNLNQLATGTAVRVGREGEAGAPGGGGLRGEGRAGAQAPRDGARADGGRK